MLASLMAAVSGGGGGTSAAANTYTGKGLPNANGDSNTGASPTGQTSAPGTDESSGYSLKPQHRGHPQAENH